MTDERAASVEQLAAAAGGLVTRTTARLEQLPWYRSLDPEVRSWVSVVISAGIEGFVAWLREGDAAAGTPVSAFAAAPRAVSRRVSLEQTVALVRTTVDVVEEAVGELAAPGTERWLRESTLRYSREIAFAVANVYARAAEERGAWDARLQALVVDGLIMGEPGRLTAVRVAALGWSRDCPVVAVAAEVPSDDVEDRLEELHHRATKLGATTIAGLHGDRLVVLVGRPEDPTPLAGELVGELTSGSVVVGPLVPDVALAGGSVREALSGLDVVAGWSGAPRVVPATALLPERALAGDREAARRLVDEVYRPLLEAGPDLVPTLTAHLEQSRSLEETARTLFVHVNTVRYRLGRVQERLGLSAADPRDALTLRVAITLGRIDDARTAGLRDSAPVGDILQS